MNTSTHHVVYDRKKYIFENYLEDYFRQYNDTPHAPIAHLTKSMKYSTGNGGKRFRPILSLLVSDLLSGSDEQILPFALAIELIHTYSLIHDDLPCMDNDDLANQIIQLRLDGEQQYNVRATPTFVLRISIAPCRSRGLSP